MGIQTDLSLSSPWMNAAGFGGFHPGGDWFLPERPGAFVTHPISWLAREPAHDRTLIEYPGGFLLHTGHPNPGFRAALRKYQSRWERSETPIWVHLLAEEPGSVHQMVCMLENIEAVAAIEISLPPAVDIERARDLLNAAYGEMPLVACLPVSEVESPWAQALAEFPLAAVALTAPRGRLQNGAGKWISGRLYGSGTFPFLTSAFFSLQRRTSLPLIFSGGILRRSQAEMLLKAGACAVQLDTALWRGWLAD